MEMALKISSNPHPVRKLRGQRRRIQGLTMALLLGSMVACAPGFAPLAHDPSIPTFTVDQADTKSNSTSPQISYEQPASLLPPELAPKIPTQHDTPSAIFNPEHQPLDLKPKANQPPPIKLPDDFDEDTPAQTAPTPQTPSAPSAPSVAIPEATPEASPVATPPSSPPATPELSASPSPTASPTAAPEVAPTATPNPQSGSVPDPSPTAQPTPIAAPQPLQPPQPPTPTTQTQAVLVCDQTDPAHCPSTVGLIVTRTTAWIGQCTASLIGEQTLITNSHCIPDELKQDGADCSKNMAVYFPQTATNPAEKVKCEKVLHISKIAKEGEPGFGLEADYAVLQLARVVTRPHLTIRRDLGLTDDLKLVAYAIDPKYGGRTMGILKVKMCSARQGSIAAPSFVQNFAGVGAFSGCEIIPGNSGSPAIDRDGNMRALVHATIPSKTAIVPQTEKSQTFHRMAMLTNIACTDIPKEVGPNAGTAHPDCLKTLASDDVIRAAYGKTDDRNLTPLADTWMKTAPQNFEFDVRRSDSANSVVHMLTAQIKCVKDPKQWMAPSMQTRTQSTADTTNLKVTLPSFGFVVNLDDDYRVSLTPGTIDQLDLSFDFNPQTLSKTRFVKSRATITSRNSKQQTIQNDFNLFLCK